MISHTNQGLKKQYRTTLSSAQSILLGCMQLQLRLLHWQHLSTISHNTKDLNPKLQHQPQF